MLAIACDRCDSMFVAARRARHVRSDEKSGHGGDTPLQPTPLIGFYPGSRAEMPITTAPRWRGWMNDMEERWGNRCLPLLVANEAGWTLLNPIAFAATWSGDPHQDALEIEFLGGTRPSPSPVTSQFGYGIITWPVPYLFRTPPGYNLLVRGPANWPKDGATALEGLVETDWAVATFTMNWKLTRPGHRVEFDEEEPFCMIVPQRRGELESFAPEVRPLASDPQLLDETGRWTRARRDVSLRKFLGQYSNDFADAKTEWERNYFSGRTPDGTPAPEHETHLRLRDFTGIDPPSE